MPSPASDVTDFLGSIGLEQCVQAVVHNGFYTSMEALRGTTYEELVDCGVRPVHAKLILSNLGSKSTLPPMGEQPLADEAAGGAEEVATFLRSVGLEVCLTPLTEAGYTSLDLLGRAPLQDLLAAGVKPVHARLIVSNLDSATSAGINMTPAAQRNVSLDEETLLGGPRKRRTPSKLYLGGALLVLLLLLAAFGFGSGGGSGAPSSPALASGAEARGAKGKGVGGPHKGKGAAGKGMMKEAGKPKEGKAKEALSKAKEEADKPKSEPAA